MLGSSTLILYKEIMSQCTNTNEQISTPLVPYPLELADFSISLLKFSSLLLNLSLQIRVVATLIQSQLHIKAIQSNLQVIMRDPYPQ